MFLGELLNNLRKAIKVLRIDGFTPLVRIIIDRSKIYLNLKFNKYVKKSGFSNKEFKVRYGLIIFTNVPYDDIGGGQRSAQLSRAAIRVGMDVLYVYAYPKYDFSKRRNVVSRVSVPHLTHKHINELTARQFLGSIRGDSVVVFEMPHPLFVGYLEICRNRGVRTVFELIDDWSTSLGGDWYQEEVLKVYKSQAEVVTGTSQVLVDGLREMGRADAIYLPNGANEYIFDQNKIYRRPTDVPEKPIALYMGSLYGEWFGWEYVREAAERNPEIGFCLIGSKPVRVPVVLPKNVHFLGEKGIEELPGYLQAADFCLLPFKPGRLSDAVSPIKAFEYRFMGKAIVSTDLAEVRGVPNVYIARNEAEFAGLCGRLQGQSGQGGKSRSDMDEFISRNSWYSRLQKVMDVQGRHNVSVIILIHNNRDIIGRCIGSLLENCSSYISDVVVVDNASEDRGGEYVERSFEQVRVVRNAKNGCSSGRNLGVRNSQGKYVAFFDSDQWFTSGWGFEEALKILEMHAEIGAVGWSGGWFFLHEENLVGPVVDYFPYRARNADIILKGFRIDIAYLSTAGLFLPRTIFEAIGGFDEAYDPTSFEDTDLSLMVKKLGFEIAYRDLTGIQHERHQTTRAHEKSTKYRELFSKNSEYFLNKWKNYRHFFLEKNKWMF
jgi:glycosyltransferase involved in cell wall biosynthesis